jgi:hypothetical protein
VNVFKHVCHERQIWKYLFAVISEWFEILLVAVVRRDCLAKNQNLLTPGSRLMYSKLSRAGMRSSACCLAKEEEKALWTLSF